MPTDTSEQKQKLPFYKEPFLIILFVLLLLVILGGSSYLLTRTNKKAVSTFLTNVGLVPTEAPRDMSMYIGVEQSCETNGVIIPCSFSGNGFTYENLSDNKGSEFLPQTSMLYCEEPDYPVAKDCLIDYNLQHLSSDVPTVATTTEATPTVTAEATTVITTVAPTKKQITPTATQTPVQTTTAPTAVQYTEQHCQISNQSTAYRCGAWKDGYEDEYFIYETQQAIRCLTKGFPLATGCYNIPTPRCNITNGISSVIGKTWYCLSINTTSDGKSVHSPYASKTNYPSNRYIGKPCRFDCEVLVCDTATTLTTPATNCRTGYYVGNCAGLPFEDCLDMD